MRTTLHIVPFDIASVLHMATLDLRLADCKLFFRRNAISIEQVNDMEDDLINFINSPKTSVEIEEAILEKIEFVETDLKKECAKKILKYFWEIGTLCYVNFAENWEKEERRYAVTKQFYSDIDLKQYDIKKAQELLVLEYIRKFGPATIKDLSWWSGLSLKVVREIIERNECSITRFKVNGFETDFYILAEEVQKLEEYKLYNSEWVTLLAYEDPSLKGYYESRYRYVDKRYYNLLFNQIGEVRASILCNGKAIGIWKWDKKNKKIELEYFFNPNESIKRKVKEIKELYESMLFPDQQITLFDH